MALNQAIRCLISSKLFIFLLFFQSVFAQRDLSSFEQVLLKNKDLLGKDFTVMVRDSANNLVYAKNFGVFDSKTVVPIASCSKWLTAAIVLTYVDEGKISLDDKVSRWLPEFERYGKSYITIRHCLSHLTGIEDDGRIVKRILQRKKFSSLEEEVNSFAGREIRMNAGQDFWYGNIGLNIAARVLEVITKKKFESLATSRLFRPLGMTKTSFANQDGSPPNPSGGAKSNADDYMKFLMMLLRDGMHNGKQVLSKSSVDLLRRVQTAGLPVTYAPASANGFQYALGSWVIESKDGRATSLTSPGLFGSWPMVDFEKGYAYLVVVKNFLKEERAGIHVELKRELDGVF